MMKKESQMEGTAGKSSCPLSGAGIEAPSRTATKNGETGLFQCRLSRQQKQNDIHSKYTVEEGHSNPNGARTEHTAEGGCCIRTRKRGSEKMAIGKGRNRIRQKSEMLFT
ncbi:hypothetical protein [Phocaeicola sp.]|uniref:hypothetical protein n=1 Tax=Phocaeicola sp. TaxID=2773926 RepID=UPI002A8119A5|nr:hypothetical protein [Phocaeicola sp.]